MHFSERKWSFFVGDNAYIDKMGKLCAEYFYSVRDAGHTGSVVKFSSYICTAGASLPIYEAAIIIIIVKKKSRVSNLPSAQNLRAFDAFLN